MPICGTCLTPYKDHRRLVQITDLLFLSFFISSPLPSSKPVEQSPLNPIDQQPSRIVAVNHFPPYPKRQ